MISIYFVKCFLNYSSISFIGPINGVIWIRFLNDVLWFVVISKTEALAISVDVNMLLVSLVINSSATWTFAVDLILVVIHLFELELVQDIGMVTTALITSYNCFALVQWLVGHVDLDVLEHSWWVKNSSLDLVESSWTVRVCSLHVFGVSRCKWSWWLI